MTKSTECRCSIQILLSRGCPSTKGGKCPSISWPMSMDDEVTKPAARKLVLKKIAVTSNNDWLTDDAYPALD